MSHTASLAGNGAVISGALAQVGAVEAHDFKQMMDLCRTLADYADIEPLDSRRVAILTMSGAAGIVSSDFIEDHGLEVADLSADTMEALKQIYPGWMSVANPVDLWAVELHDRKEAITRAFEAVCADPGVDAVLFHAFVGGDAFRPEISTLVEMAGQALKPIFGWIMGKRTEAHKLQLTASPYGIQFIYLSYPNRRSQHVDVPPILFSMMAKTCILS